MNIIYFLLPVALFLAFGFAASFAVAALNGQFDDMETPAHRALIDEDDVSQTEIQSINENDEKGSTAVEKKGHA